MLRGRFVHRLAAVPQLVLCRDGTGSAGLDGVVSDGSSQEPGDAEHRLLLLYLFFCVCSKADVPLLAESVWRVMLAHQ